MKDILKRGGLALLCTLGVLIVFGFLMDALGDLTHRRLMSVFGWGAVVFTGLCGTPVHELGHWLGCKLFGFTVTDVALFRPVSGRYDGILGYVSYSYPAGTLRGSLGSFFTGIAPLIFGGAVILLVLRFLTPELWRSVTEGMEGRDGAPRRLWGAFAGFWRGLFRLRGWGILRGVLCLYIVSSVSVHMSLSPADLSGAAIGIPALLLGFLLYGVITHALKTDYRGGCIRTAASLSAFFCIGLVFCLLTLAVSLLLSAF